MNQDQELRIQSLEKQVRDLTNMLASISQNSTATQIYFRNILRTDLQSKVGFFGVTPTGQQAAITAPSGGATVDSQARTAIGSLITAIKNFGITL